VILFFSKGSTALAEGASSHSGFLDYVKVIGGLITAIIAVFEYAAHNEQERSTAVLNAMQLVQQGQGTNQLRQDISTLITPFYDPAQYNGNVDIDLIKDRDKVRSFIEDHIFRGQKLRFKNSIDFLESMYQFGSTNSCTWKVIATTYHGDAGELVYYFEPEFQRYADQQKISMAFLYDIEYQYGNPKLIPCDIANGPSWLTRMKSYVDGLL
jgi:hypothetical protein